MSRPPRHIREDRIERDDGDPEDTVLVGKYHGSSTVAYHDDGDCTRIKNPEQYREWTRGRAQQAGRTPCSECILGSTNHSDSLEATCPLCGDEVGILPSHLPDCDGSPDAARVVSDD
jgi:hypothetical protein